MHQKRESNVWLWLGLALTLSAGAVLALHFTAVPVVLDVYLVSLVLAALAAVVLACGLTRKRSLWRAAPAFSAIGAAGLAGAIVLAFIAGHLSFLSFGKEEIVFENGDVSLAGTLYLPGTDGPYPALIIVHGSGPESRREYAYYARRFAQAGIAALAYDKRGVGQSTGKLYQSDYHDYASDVVATIQGLRSRPDIDADKIGLLGFSEAEWTAPLAAVQNGNIAFIAIIGASGMTPAEQVNAEIGIRMRRHGHSEQTIRQAMDLNSRVFAYQRTGEGGEELKAALDAASAQPWFRDAGDIPSEIYPVDEYAWWRSVMDFEPGPVWERVSAPVLLLKGGRDAHSTPEHAKQAISAALQRGGNQQVDFVLIPTGDHLLLEWPLGRGVPPPIFAADFLNTLITWVKTKVQ